MAGSGLGWFGIVRLGLGQAAPGAIVGLTTSPINPVVVLTILTTNRVIIVELALPAMVPGLFGTWHYALQVLRPSWGTVPTGVAAARRGSSPAWRRWRSAASARRWPSIS